MRLRVKNFTIATIGLLAVLLLAQAVIAVVNLQSLHSMTDQIVSARLPELRNIAQIDALTTRYRLRAFRHILAEDPAQKAEIDKQIKQASAELEVEFASFESRMTEAQKKMGWNAFKTGWDAYEALQGRALIESRAGQMAAATDILESSRDLFVSLTASLQHAIENNRRRSDENFASVGARFTSAVWATGGFAGAAFLLTLGLGIFFVRRVSDPLIALTGAMQSVAKGDLRHPVPEMITTSEIDDMAAALVILRDGLANAEKQRLEQAELDFANLRLMNDAQQALNDHAQFLDEQVVEKTQHLAEREREIVWRLSRATERRDTDTGDHIARMSRICGLIAEAMGLPKEECRTIEIASQMHDVGKVGIPDDILFKVGKFTPEERKLMETHVLLGWEILHGSESSLIQTAAEIAMSHHERWDGKGYPKGLAGEAIPLSGRITAVADVFDALTSVRPYKHAWSLDEAVAFIEENAGKHFDPECVEAFLFRIDEISAISGVSAHEIAPQIRANER